MTDRDARIEIPTTTGTGKYRIGSATPAQVERFREIAANTGGRYAAHQDRTLKTGPESDFTLLLDLPGGRIESVTVTPGGHRRGYLAMLPDHPDVEGNQAEGWGGTPAEAATSAARAAGINPVLVRVVGRDADSGEWALAVGDEPVIAGTVVEHEE